MRTDLRCLFLGKGNDYLTSELAAFTRANWPQTEIHLGKRTDPFPSLADGCEWDVVISYLCPWIVPSSLLRKARVAAINFHPGPPEYPGTGCTNFAIYNQEQSFGVTCHHMVEQVDAGPIIRVARFPLYPNDSVYSLTIRAYVVLAGVFYEVIDCFVQGRSLPRSDEKWTGTRRTRRELDALCRIEFAMSPDEIQRRIRATVFPGAMGPFVEVAGHRFSLERGSNR